MIRPASCDSSTSSLECLTFCPDPIDCSVSNHFSERVRSSRTTDPKPTVPVEQKATDHVLRRVSFSIDLYQLLDHPRCREVRQAGPPR